MPNSLSVESMPQYRRIESMSKVLIWLDNPSLFRKADKCPQKRGAGKNGERRTGNRTYAGFDSSVE